MMQEVATNPGFWTAFEFDVRNGSYETTHLMHGNETNSTHANFSRLSTTRRPGADLLQPTQESTYLTLYCVVFIGFAGSLANGVVLFAFLDKNLRKQTKNVLLITQVSFDFLSCVLMTVSYLVKIPLASDDSQGTIVRKWGRVVCILFVSDGLFYIAGDALAANLAMIALERYFKIVHPVGHRNHFRRWMLYLAIGFDIIYGFSSTIMMYWTSGFDKYGKCNSYTNWPNATSERVNATTQLFMIYIVVLAIFFYCYGRIIHTMRKKANVAPTHIKVTSQMTSNPPNQRERTKGGQANVIKTMLLVSTVYGITTAPALFGFVILAFDKMNEFLNETWVYYAEMGLVIVNIILDPYIYAFSLDCVRKKLITMLCFWRKIPEPSA